MSFIIKKVFSSGNKLASGKWDTALTGSVIQIQQEKIIKRIVGYGCLQDVKWRFQNKENWVRLIKCGASGRIGKSVMTKLVTIFYLCKLFNLKLLTGETFTVFTLCDALSNSDSFFAVRVDIQVFPV